MTSYIVTLEEVVKKHFRVDANSEEEVQDRILKYNEMLCMWDYDPYVEGVESYGEPEDTGEYLYRIEIEEIEND